MTDIIWRGEDKMNEVRNIQPVLKDSYIYYDGTVHVGDIDLLILDSNPSAYLLSLKCRKQYKILTKEYHVYKNIEALSTAKKCPHCFKEREA